MARLVHARKLKAVSPTKHNKKGIHGTKLPSAARKDAWKHKGQAKGQ